MEFIEGENLRRMIERHGRLEVAFVLQIQADRDADWIAARIARCAFEQAEAGWAAADAVARLSQRPVPDAVRRQRVWLAFWRGHFEEAAHALAACAPGAERDGLYGLLAWATGDRHGVEAHTWRLGQLSRDPDARFWQGALRLLAAGMRSDRRRLEAGAGAFVEGLRRRATERFGRVIAAEACLAAGMRAEAMRALGDAGAWRAATPLERLLYDRVSLGVAPNGAASAALGAAIARVGAAGICFWGQGSATMYLLQAIPALLQVLSEAEDEVAALTGACRWVRERSGADEVTILDAAHGRTIGGPVTSREMLSDDERRVVGGVEETTVLRRPDGLLVAAPIRYAGIRIGAVAISGPAHREATLVDAASAVAAVTAPAVRARLDAVSLCEQSHTRTPEILGRSPAIAALREAIVRAAASPFPVLIEGESGAGKELVARAIHRLSARRDRRFAALNCAALNDELAETELFGHTRGAFTGAVGARVGLFEEAHGGTLFLDEVGELSPRTQAKLLRALQEREVRRLGENTARRVDVRLVAATNRSLTGMVGAGAFREDLLFRLAVIRLRVPPLRDRPEDLAPLAIRFWRAAAPEAGTRAVLGPDALARLSRHAWPGNVRELQNVIAGVAVLAPARGRIGARHVDLVLSGASVVPSAPSLDRVRAEVERREVAAALVRNAGRRTAAARELGMTRQGLAKAIKRLRLDRGEPVEGVA
jgi:two-component system response regulator HydG